MLGRLNLYFATEWTELAGQSRKPSLLLYAVDHALGCLREWQADEDRSKPCRTK